MLAEAVDLGAVGERLRAVDARWLVLPFVALTVQFALRAQRWALLLRSACGAAVPASTIAPAMAVGYLANAVLPARLGEVARTLVAARTTQLNIATVAASVVVERLIDLAALVTLAVLGTAVAATIGWHVAIAAAVALLAGPHVMRRAAAVLTSRLPGWLPPSVRRPAVRVLGALSGIGPRSMFYALILSSLAWAGDIAVVWLCAQAIGTNISPAAALTIAVGAALATALPAAGGYLGTYELGAVAFGAMAGVPSSTSLAVALVAHAFAVLPLALVGVVVILRGGVRWMLPSRGHVSTQGDARLP
jgi:hypothetical protein